MNLLQKESISLRNRILLGFDMLKMKIFVLTSLGYKAIEAQEPITFLESWDIVFIKKIIVNNPKFNIDLNSSPAISCILGYWFHQNALKYTCIYTLFWDGMI